jgi:hypothetical protein
MHTWIYSDFGRNKYIVIHTGTKTILLRIQSKLWWSCSCMCSYSCIHALTCVCVFMHIYKFCRLRKQCKSRALRFFREMMTDLWTTGLSGVSLRGHEGVIFLLFVFLVLKNHFEYEELFWMYNYIGARVHRKWGTKKIFGNLHWFSIVRWTFHDLAYLIC